MILLGEHNGYLSLPRARPHKKDTRKRKKIWQSLLWTKENFLLLFTGPSMTVFNTNYSYRRPSSKKQRGTIRYFGIKTRENALLAVRSNAPSKQNVHGGSQPASKEPCVVQRKEHSCRPPWCLTTVNTTLLSPAALRLAIAFPAGSCSIWGRALINGMMG